jgi:hypothetical protein
MRILVVCIFIHQFASLTVLRRRHSVVSDKRETTLGRQLFYCASGNTRSLYFKLKCADVAAHTLKNVVFQTLSFIIENVPPRNLKTCLTLYCALFINGTPDAWAHTEFFLEEVV